MDSVRAPAPFESAFVTKFSDLGLIEPLQRALAAKGYDMPTPIQAQSIPPLLEGRDLCGIAQTGTGKTAAFALPSLHLLSENLKHTPPQGCRMLVLSPTRELASQIAESFVQYGKNLRLSVATVFGGVPINRQIRQLQRGVDILVATPGRLLDLIDQRALNLKFVEIFVLDEADQMLDLGFIHALKRIDQLLPKKRQSLFFSATMPPEIQKLADQFLQNPERIEVAPPSSTAKTVTQRLVACHNKDYEKRSTLRDLIRAQDDLKNAIIFCNRKKDVADLFRSLERHGFSVGALHGDMDQRSRTTMLAGFKANAITLLVASDVAARGLDIPDVSHVFNFDVPIHAEDYVHRIGRTGRAGRSGAAFTLVTRSDTKFLDAIEKLIDQKIEWLDGDLSALPAPAESHDESRGKRGRDKGRERRGGHKSDTRSEYVKPVEEQQVVEAVKVEVVKAEPVAAERRTDKRRDQNPRNNRNNPSPANDDNRDRRRNRHHDHDDGPTPVGFGDDIPAFMLIVAAAKA